MWEDNIRHDWEDTNKTPVQADKCTCFSWTGGKDMWEVSVVPTDEWKPCPVHPVPGGKPPKKKKYLPPPQDLEERVEYKDLDEIGQTLWLFLGHFFALGKYGKEWDDVSHLVAEKRKLLQPYLEKRETAARKEELDIILEELRCGGTGTSAFEVIEARLKELE